MRRGLLTAGLALLLAGCVNLAERRDTPAVTYYVLNDSAAAAVTAGRPNAPTLLVLDTTASGFYDSDQLIFSRRADTRGQYQFARWTERPGKRLADLMRTRLDRQGIWNVTAGGGHVRGDVLLDTELIELYHDAATQPGQVRLELRAELVDLRQRKVIARRSFEQTVAVPSYDASGAAAASSLAVTRMLDELTAWLASYR